METPKTSEPPPLMRTSITKPGELYGIPKNIVESSFERVELLGELTVIGVAAERVNTQVADGIW